LRINNYLHHILHIIHTPPDTCHTRVEIMSLVKRGPKRIGVGLKVAPRPRLWCTPSSALASLFW